MDPKTLTQQLDDRHVAAQVAFRQKDLAAYRKIFSPTLVYERPNASAIGQQELMRDVAAQFRRVSAAHSMYERTSISGSDQNATEVLVQTASAEVVAFGFLRRRWSINRRATYHWIKSGDAWLVERVEVANETVTHTGWGFSRKRLL